MEILLVPNDPIRDHGKRFTHCVKVLHYFIASLKEKEYTVCSSVGGVEVDVLIDSQGL